jgi:hypothetical protein
VHGWTCENADEMRLQAGERGRIQLIRLAGRFAGGQRLPEDRTGGNGLRAAGLIIAAGSEPEDRLFERMRNRATIRLRRH